MTWCAREQTAVVWSSASRDAGLTVDRESVWNEVVGKYRETLGLAERMTGDQNAWKFAYLKKHSQAKCGCHCMQVYPPSRNPLQPNISNLAGLWVHLLCQYCKEHYPKHSVKWLVLERASSN